MANILKSLYQRIKSWNQESVARWLAGDDLDNTRKYKIPTQPYATIAWVRKAIACVAGAASSVPLVVSLRDGDVFEGGPLIDLFQRLGKNFRYEVVGQHLLTGEAHIVFDLVKVGADTIHVFGFNSMKSLISEDGLELLGWEVSVPDKNGAIRKYTVDLGSVVSWIDPNLYPGSKFRGLSRLKALALYMAEDQAAGEHNAALLSSGGGPKGVLTTDQNLEPQQAQQIEDRWNAKFSGVANTGKTAVLMRGTSWQSLVQNNKELLLIDSRKVARETILSIYDVPPSVAGLFEGQNRAHDQSAREGFWVNTVWPISERLGEFFTEAFVPRFQKQNMPTNAINMKHSLCFRAAKLRTARQVIVWFDMGKVPALRAWHAAQARTALDLLDAGIPLNEVIEKCDLPFELQPWGDTWWVPTGKLPVDVVIEQAKAAIENLRNPPMWLPTEDDTTPPPKQLTVDEAQLRTVVWDKWVTSWRGLEKKTIQQLRAYFFRQRKETLAKLEKNLPTTPVLSNPKGWLDDILPDLVNENKLLIDLVTPLYGSGISLGSAQVAEEISGIDPFNIPDPSFDKFLPERFSKVVNANNTTKEKLRKTLQQGHDENENVTQLAQRIKDTFREATDSRALSISRTETAMSVSQGRNEAMRENNVERKGWLTAGDEHVRDSHREAGFEYASGIPLDVPFRLAGGEVMYPSDPNGPPGEIINCRCVVLAITVDKTFVQMLLIYKEKGFVSWQEKTAA